MSRAEKEPPAASLPFFGSPCLAREETLCLSSCGVAFVARPPLYTLLPALLASAIQNRFFFCFSLLSCLFVFVFA
jgi:hypothetical protein